MLKEISLDVVVAVYKPTAQLTKDSRKCPCHAGRVARPGKDTDGARFAGASLRRGEAMSLPSVLLFPTQQQAGKTVPSLGARGAGTTMGSGCYRLTAEKWPDSYIRFVCTFRARLRARARDKLWTLDGAPLERNRRPTRFFAIAH
jgi:hypothetical protein